MNTLQKYMPFFATTVLMCVVLLIIYPHYQYYIDPDGTAYLTISKRYAEGDFAKAINGYWSPWSCWLTALLIKTGLQAIPASVIVNAVGATGMLYISQSFFLKFDITRNLQWLLGITLGLFLCYAIFWQSFDDLWECFFLLATLRIMLSDSFKQKPVLWITTGLIGALAYFAKAYSFPFFILNTLVCTYFICKGDKAQWIKISALSIITMILCSLPWITLLHNKYGIWTTSTSGSLNMSWYLVGHPHWKNGLGGLLPPAYPDSPYYWEDPYYANGATPHFWSSFHLLGLQILRIGYNLVKLIASSLIQLSVFLPLIILLSFHYLRGRDDIFPASVKVLVISFLLFPLGYIPINFESRYIWYMLPIFMVLGAIRIQAAIPANKNIVAVAVALSILAYPIYCMCGMWNVGKQEYTWAQELKAHHIDGTFTSNSIPGKATQSMIRLAYFSGNPFYVAPQKITHKELIKEIRRYHIKYYINSPLGNNATTKPFCDENGIPFPVVDSTAGKVFLVSP